MLKVLGTLFVPLDVISISLFAVIGYCLVWVGSSGGKKRYYKTAAVMFFTDSVSAVVKLLVLRPVGSVVFGFFTGRGYDTAAYTVFCLVTAAAMVLQGILALRSCRLSSDNGHFLE